MLDSFDFNLSGILWPIVVLSIGFILYQGLQKAFSLSDKKRSNLVLQKQITNILFILLLIIIFVIALPIKDSIKNQIISLIGIVLSASIALSSATFLGNIMAGIWLRSAILKQGTSSKLKICLDGSLDAVCCTLSCKVLIAI